MNGNRREKRHRTTGARLLLAVGCIVCAGAGLLLFGMRHFKTASITVTGLSYYTEEEFLNKISSPRARKNVVWFRVEQYLKGQKRIPYVEKYDYTVDPENGITIQVYEKILIGCISMMGQYVYFDKDGYVTESSEEPLPGIPVIKGLSFDRMIMYEKLDVEKDRLYGVILNIAKLVREYELPVSSVTFDSRGNVELEVETLTVELGKRDAYEKPVQRLAQMLPSIRGRALTVDLSNYQGGEEDIIAKPKTE